MEYSAAVKKEWENTLSGVLFECKVENSACGMLSLCEEEGNENIYSIVHKEHWKINNELMKMVTNGAREEGVEVERVKVSRLSAYVILSLNM